MSLEVQSPLEPPPGLEEAPACVVPPGLKEELVREVAAAVRDHVDERANNAVENLWQKGEKAVAALAQQQATRSEELGSKLAECAASYRQLQRENAELRRSLEAVVRHLHTHLGQPPAMAAAAAAAHGHIPAAPPMTPPTAPATPPVAGPEAGEEVGSVFNLTLRRADNVPLGLSVREDSRGLLVEAVQSGGAVEAWNRQCAGREVRPGDTIVRVNGATGAMEMREQCMSQQLLKLAVLRGAGEASLAREGHTSNNANSMAGAATLRAGAEEFVPLNRAEEGAAAGAGN